MATAALNWYGSVGYLGQQFRVVAPNLRGHGRQGQVSPPFSLEGCAEDLAALVNELGLRGVIVVGYSMGGAVAQVLGRRHPELLGGIVLCATAANFARRPWLRPLVRPVGGTMASVARAWPRQAEDLLNRRLDRYDRALAKRATGGLGTAEWALEERALSHLAAFIEAGTELNAFNSTGWLGALEVPAAVVVTGRDAVVAPWRQFAMAAMLPDAKWYVVDAGHDVVVAQPEVFLPILARACVDLAARRPRQAGV
jgi:pimeloyl-ACP methyl ester carboxylesterase